MGIKSLTVENKLSHSSLLRFLLQHSNPIRNNKTLRFLFNRNSSPLPPPLTGEFYGHLRPPKPELRRAALQALSLLEFAKRFVVFEPFRSERAKVLQNGVVRGQVATSSATETPSRSFQLPLLSM